MSHEHHADASHGNMKQYSIGFLVSVLLTIVPFYMVMHAADFSRGSIVATIAITAVAQVLVQLVFFLHMNSSAEQRWNVIAFIYTILTIAVLLVGSVWIMNYLHSNMMI